MRQIVLDTETTGLEPLEGHRIIEIGGVELVNRRLTGNNYHQYLNPDRQIDAGAVAVHGIANDFLADKPRFTDVAAELLAYLDGAELIIHNAPFDVGFINAELQYLMRDLGRIEDRCRVLDTLVLARDLHPGQKNSLDALCKRYAVDNSGRELHGALLDAQILAEVYLAMTGGQTTLLLSGEGTDAAAAMAAGARRLGDARPALKVLRATPEEATLHEARLREIDEASPAGCLWLDQAAGRDTPAG